MSRRWNADIRLALFSDVPASRILLVICLLHTARTKLLKLMLSITFTQLLLVALFNAGVPGCLHSFACQPSLSWTFHDIAAFCVVRATKSLDQARQPHRPIYLMEHVIANSPFQLGRATF